MSECTHNCETCSANCGSRDKKSLLENLNTLENGKENVLKIYHILLLNVLRIYPYAKDDLTIDFLNSSVDHVLTTSIKTKRFRTSQVTQGLRIPLAMQGMGVRPLVKELRPHRPWSS